MIVLRLVAVSVVLLVVAACRSQSDSLTNNKQTPDTVVSSTPPFHTKEPDRYRAVRTITTVNAAGETVVKTSLARDGESRRLESNASVYIDVPEGKFLLVPGEKVYADLGDESTIVADQNDEELEVSPERLLHEDSGKTGYQNLGSEVVLGRNTKKYRIVVNSSAAANVSQSETLMWIDEALQMPVRSETKSADGTRVTMELSDIKMEVDKDLFKVPEGYQKIKFSELRKRLSKS